MSDTLDTTPAVAASLPKKKRLYSLDALRGFDMFWIMSGEHIIHAAAKVTGWPVLLWMSGQRHHSDWNGFTFYDISGALPFLSTRGFGPVPSYYLLADGYHPSICFLPDCGCFRLEEMGNTIDLDWFKLDTDLPLRRRFSQLWSHSKFPIRRIN